jgi:hypothetical protein
MKGMLLISLRVSRFCKLIIWSTAMCVFVGVFPCSGLRRVLNIHHEYSSLGVTQSMRMTRSFDLTVHPFTKHFDTLVRLYGKVFCINLLANSKSNE